MTEKDLEDFVNASNSDDDDDAPPENVSEEEDHISDWESNAEQSDSEVESDEETQTTSGIQEILSKNKDVIWNLQPFTQSGRMSSKDVIKGTPGPTRYAISRIDDIQSAFKLFINITIQNIIIQMSNIEGQQVYGEKWKTLDLTALNAFIGLLLLAGVYRSYCQSTSTLWDSETGRHIFRATMSVKRFHQISRVLRFDNKSNRIERRATDKLAPIRDLWNKWVENLPIFYNPGDNVTVDEQLVSFRGRCPFRQCIQSKPAKYGIKIWTLCDSKSVYALNAQVYIGKQAGQSENNQGMRVVLDLTQGLKGQNVTCDNFFTSYQLGQVLMKRKITMLGTIRKNKPLPQGILSKRDIYSSMFYFTKDTTVVSYVPKKFKQGILMSTMHHDSKISNRDDRKPDIILEYNATKGAVDTLDQLIGTYTCKRKTNRWPMVIFYNMLDVSAYNAFVLWKEIDPNWNKNILYKRRLFLEELGKSLVSPYIEE
ncbi:LOW QUALITY PROTEIN: piggyBac transposable element-derived protein 4-like [Anomaloglossus baeobatrachus]